MKLKWKSLLACLLAAAMMVTGVPYDNGTSVVYAQTEGADSGTADDEEEESETDAEEKADAQEEAEADEDGDNTADDEDADDDSGDESDGDADDEEADGEGDGDSEDDNDSDGDEEDKTSDADGEEEAVNAIAAEVEAEEETICEHDNVSYISNEDGTHQIICDDCDETIEDEEECTFISLEEYEAENEKDASGDESDEEDEDASGDESDEEDEDASDDEDDDENDEEDADGTVLICKYCGYEKEEKTTVVRKKRSAGSLIAKFTFDDEESGFSDGGYTAEMQSGSTALTEDGYSSVTGGALDLSGSQYLKVEDEDGISPLEGLSEFTISYYSKYAGGDGWTFFAYPEDYPSPSWPNEHYLGVIDISASVEVQRWANSGSRAASITKSGLNNIWRHVAIVFDEVESGETDTFLYIDGILQGSLETGVDLTELLGDGSIMQIGKANWGNGEYFEGLLDEYSIYDYALDADEIEALYEDGLEGDGEVDDPMLLAHYSFGDIARYDDNEELVSRNSVSEGAVIPNTSEDTEDEEYDAVLYGEGAMLRADSLVLPGTTGKSDDGHAGSDNPAYVKLPGEMLLDGDGKMIDTMTVNIWLQNMSASGDWTAMYVGTDAEENSGNTTRPLNYWLLNPRKSGSFKSVLTNNTEATSAPYNNEEGITDGSTAKYWQMYTVVITPTQMTTYLDGEILGRTTHSMKMSEWTADGSGTDTPDILAYIGKGGYTTDALWNGAVKECSIYNYALDADEIEELYEDVIPEVSSEALKTGESVSTDFLQGNDSAEISYGEAYELPVKTSVIMTDGTSDTAYVTWYDEDGNVVSDTTTLEEGTYTLTGKLENYFPEPFIEERADPQVYYDEESETYYFTSSWPAYGSIDSGYDKIVIRKSDTLLGLADAEEYTIWEAPGEIYTGQYHIWAPELHHIGDKWYCYFAGTIDGGSWSIRPRILVCDDEDDITDADNWTEHARFTDMNGEYDAGLSSMSLDMTYFENNNRSYVIYATISPKSRLLLGEVDKDDPTKLLSEPLELAYPEYDWERVNEVVNEGPSVLQTNGKVYIVYSASGTGDEYCMGMMSADADDDMLDIGSWTKKSVPILQTSDLTHQYGPGHNSFTVDEDGNAILVYHARDEECHNNECGYSSGSSLYDPCRNALLAYVRYDEDGAPVLSSTANKELADIDTSNLVFTLTVGGAEEESDPVASYALGSDTKDGSGNGYDGVLHGGAASVENALLLQGTETGNLVNYLDLSDNGELLERLAEAKSITLTAWVRNDTTNTNNNNRPTVFTIGSDEDNFFAFSTGNWGQARASFYVGGTEVGDSGGTTRIQYNTDGMTASVLGEWYPVAITLTDISTDAAAQTRVRYYMNDELVCSVISPAALSEFDDLSMLYIGGGVNDGYHDMYGAIRNVRIYETALPQETLLANDLAYLPENLALTLGADTETYELTVSGDMELPVTGYPDVTYTWTSSDETVMDAAGTLVGVSDEAQEITLTAVITSALDESYSETVIFPVMVDTTAATLIDAEYEALAINNIDDVRGNLYLPTEGATYPQVLITWESENPDIITDEEADGIAPGVVTRPNKNTDVILTATLSIEGADYTRTKEFTAKVKKAASLDEFTDYMFAYFIGEGTSTGEQMYFADSRDGLNWTALNDGAPVITSDMGEKGLRDPFIMRSHEGDKFYLLATDLWIAGGTSWGDSQTSGSKSIMVWESTDLVNWSEQRMCEIAPENAGCTWAPEAFWDEETEDYAVFWASKTSDDNYGVHHIWKCHTRDFYTYSEPEIWITLKNASGSDISVIDTTVLKVGDTYYRFNKNESGEAAVMTDGSTVTTKSVYMEKADSLDGKWSYVSSSYLLDSGNQYREGTTSFQFNDEDVDQDTWCLLLDNFGGGGYYPATTTDVGSGSFTKLSSSEYSFPTTGILRHGSVLNITANEYAALEYKWGSIDDSEPETTVEEAIIGGLTFDDEDTGFTDGNVLATVEGSVTLSDEVREGAGGKSAYITNGNWMDVTDGEGASLLTGLDELTISYYSKADTSSNSGWTLYIAPNTDAPTGWSSEYYLGVLDKASELTAERYYQSRGSDTSTSCSVSGLSNEWRHVVVVYDADSVKIYIDGELAASSVKSTLTDLPTLLGESSIFQIGKANWGSGEYYQGYLDDVTIFNRALTASEIAAYFYNEEIAVQYVSISAEDDASTVEKGDTLQLTAKVLPSNASNKELKWTSSDTQIATVDNSGLVSGVAEGNVTITARATDGSGIYGTYEIDVEKVEYKVYFDPNGGMLTDGGYATVEKGGLITEPSEPTRDGAVFLGWGIDQSGSSYWNFETQTVTETMYLYAIWNVTDGDSSGGSSSGNGSSDSGSSGGSSSGNGSSDSGSSGGSSSGSSSSGSSSSGSSSSGSSSSGSGTESAATGTENENTGTDGTGAGMDSKDVGTDNAAAENTQGTTTAENTAVNMANNNGNRENEPEIAGAEMAEAVGEAEHMTAALQEEIDDSTPYIEGASGEMGWSHVLADLDEIMRSDDAAQESVIVNMNGATVVPGEVFKAIKDTQAEVVLDMGNSFSWLINGREITDADIQALDMGVIFGTTSIPQKLIQSVAGERQYMNISLAHDGEFGFKARLRMNVGEENKELYANLFYYNPQTAELEFMMASQIEDSGDVEFIFTHASDYSVIIDELPMGETTADIQDIGKAGARLPFIWLLLLCAACGCGVFLLAVKRRKRD